MNDSQHPNTNWRQELDAPLYPPSTAYEAPVAVAYAMTTSNTSITRLLANPAAKEILLREIPDFVGRTSSEMLKPHLDNFSPRSLMQFGVFKAEALDRVDAQLKALPATSGAVK